MSDQAVLLHRCRVARDYIYGCKNHAGASPLFHNCESEATIIWKTISNKIQLMLYNSSYDFLSDIYELKQLAVKNSRNNKKQIDHINVIFDRAREIAQCRQPLRATVQNKHCTNAFQLIIDSASPENISTILRTLYESGQKYGSELSLESKRQKSASVGAPGKGHSSQSNQTSGVVSPSAKIPARPISQTAKNVLATIAAPAATNKSVGGASGNKTGGKGGVGRNRKKGVGSSLRVPQKSPGTECVPHPVYYGVWEHTITGAFQAQVCIYGETIELGQTFQFAHQAARAVDRSFIRVLGPENCPSEDLNFDISAYALEDINTLCQYDASLQSTLMFCREWKGLQTLDFGFLIRRQVLDQQIKNHSADENILIESANTDEVFDNHEDGNKVDDCEAAAGDGSVEEGEVSSVSQAIPPPKRQGRVNRGSASVGSDSAGEGVEAVEVKRARRSVRLGGSEDNTAGEDEMMIPEEVVSVPTVVDRCDSPFKRAAKVTRSVRSRDCTEGIDMSISSADLDTTIAQRLSRKSKGLVRPYAPPEAPLVMPMKRRSGSSVDIDAGEVIDRVPMRHDIANEAAAVGKSRLRSGKTIEKNQEVLVMPSKRPASTSSGETTNYMTYSTVATSDFVSKRTRRGGSLETSRSSDKARPVTAVTAASAPARNSGTSRSTAVGSRDIKVEHDSFATLPGDVIGRKRSVAVINLTSDDESHIDQSDAEIIPFDCRAKREKSDTQSGLSSSVSVQTLEVLSTGPEMSRAKSRRLQGGIVDVQHIIDADYTAALLPKTGSRKGATKNGRSGLSVTKKISKSSSTPIEQTKECGDKEHLTTGQGNVVGPFSRRRTRGSKFDVAENDMEKNSGGIVRHEDESKIVIAIDTSSDDEAGSVEENVGLVDDKADQADDNTRPVVDREALEQEIVIESKYGVVGKKEELVTLEGDVEDVRVMEKVVGGSGDAEESVVDGKKENGEREGTEEATANIVHIAEVNIQREIGPSDDSSEVKAPTSCKGGRDLTFKRHTRSKTVDIESEIEALLSRSSKRMRPPALAKLDNAPRKSSRLGASTTQDDKVAARTRSGSSRSSDADGVKQPARSNHSTSGNEKKRIRTKAPESLKISHILIISPMTNDTVSEKDAGSIEEIGRPLRSRRLQHTDDATSNGATSVSTAISRRSSRLPDTIVPHRQEKYAQKSGNVMSTRKRTSQVKSSTRLNAVDDNGSESTEENVMASFSYISAPRDKARSRDGKMLKVYVGRTFRDNEVGDNDPFCCGCVTDIVQMDGEGPFLFKFYNPMRCRAAPRSDNSDNWGYQGCDEIIKNPKIYQWIDSEWAKEMMK